MTLQTAFSVPIVDLVMRLQNRQFKTRLNPIRRRKVLVARERREAFDRLWKQYQLQGDNPLIKYNLPYPKMDFLNYLCDQGGSLVSGGIVAHGSNFGKYQQLVPLRKSTDATEFGNRRQIFATSDAIFATWFAILDRERYHSTHNACMRVGPSEGDWVKFYYYHLRQEDASAPPFLPGFIYLCRGVDFPSRRTNRLYAVLDLELEECGSAEPVRPLARMAVKPSDFPYLDQVEYVL